MGPTPLAYSSCSGAMYPMLPMRWCVLVRLVPGAGDLVQAGHAEVDELHDGLRLAGPPLEEDVGGLDVAVDDVGAVAVAHADEELLDPVDQARGAEALLAAEHVGEGLALQPLEHEEGLLALPAVAEQAADVGARHAGEHDGLARHRSRSSREPRDGRSRSLMATARPLALWTASKTRAIAPEPSGSRSSYSSRGTGSRRRLVLTSVRSSSAVPGGGRHRARADGSRPSDAGAWSRGARVIQSTTSRFGDPCPTSRADARA